MRPLACHSRTRSTHFDCVPVMHGSLRSQETMRKARLRAGDTNETIAAAVDAVGARLLVVLRDHPTLRMLPPLSVEALEAAEAALGVTLPDEYRTFLLRVSSGVWVDDSYYHLSFDEVVRRRGVTGGGEPDPDKRAARPFPFRAADAARAIAAHRAFEARDPDAEEPDFCIPGNPEGDGAIELYDDGTGAVKGLVVTGEQRGTVWEYGSYGWVPEYELSDGEPVQDTFLRWFRRWLTDTEEYVRAQLSEPIVIAPEQTSFACFERSLRAIPSAVFEATQLEYLNLNSDRLTEIPPAIARLTRLRELFLMRNELSVLPPEIGALASLEELQLRGNRFTTLPAEMEQLTRLEKLDLGNNAFTAIPAVVGLLPSLRVLGLEGNAISGEEIAAFVAARPGVRVTR